MESEAKMAIGFCNLVEAVGDIWENSFRKVGMADTILWKGNP